MSSPRLIEATDLWAVHRKQFAVLARRTGRLRGDVPDCPRPGCSKARAWGDSASGATVECLCGWSGNVVAWLAESQGIEDKAVAATIVRHHLSIMDPVPEHPQLDGLVLGKTYADLVEIIRGPAWEVVDGRPLRLNELGRRVMLGDKAMTDSDISATKERIQRRLVRYSARGELAYSSESVAEALLQVAAERTYNPVRDYLGSLRWDGTPRLDRVAPDILGVEGDLAQVLVRKWMLSAVARAMKPGCKVDTVLILSGEGGRRKSSFFSVLGGEWFSDTSIDPAGKDGLLACGRFWIIEFAELHSLLRGRDAATKKQFVSSATDTYRPPYGRIPVEVPRPSVFCGTTNESGFLSGDGGDRRYWPLEIERRIDLEGLAAQRDQLWAEAVVAFGAGEAWWLDEAGESALESSHRDFGATDPWDGPVAAWLEEGSSEVTTNEALAVVDLEPGRATRGDQLRMAGVLRRLGCRPSGRRRAAGGRMVRGWVRPV